MNLSPAMQKALVGMPDSDGPWMTVAEMKGVTGMAATLLVVRHGLADRRWVSWGGEPGQKRGDGYEYRLNLTGTVTKDALSVGMLVGHPDEA